MNRPPPLLPAVVLRALPVVTCIFSLVGCAVDKPAAKGAAAPIATAAATAPADAPTANGGDAERDGPAVDSPGLHVSPAIARACNLPRVDCAPSFEFDSVAIAPQDKDLLSAIANCLSVGPLRGRRVALIGRADPRGEMEYNMSLGDTRADSVRRYLRELGVDDGRLGATSRGELDATGTDDASWAHDRRVDIELAN